MVVCLEQGADLHVAQLMPLPLTVSCFGKIQLVLSFWYRPTRVVLDKEQLNRYVCMCVTLQNLYACILYLRKVIHLRLANTLTYMN